MQTILAPHGSAPGADNEPYELYHHGATFVAHLLGQALYTMNDPCSDLRQVSGAAVDLLLWIRKKPNPTRPEQMRPLQLPTCFRRLLGAALAQTVGPVVEPL
ncbi:MAG: hypothetical protein ACKPKO_45140, partial [Candidatus Fonsibacter sp.]